MAKTLLRAAGGRPSSSPPVAITGPIMRALAASSFPPASMQVNPSQYNAPGSRTMVVEFPSLDGTSDSDTEFDMPSLASRKSKM